MTPEKDRRPFGLPSSREPLQPGFVCFPLGFFDLYPDLHDSPTQLHVTSFIGPSRRHIEGLDGTLEEVTC